jgi:beta-ribofuranosylaminobenzene 5'-phosphate synthase
MGAKLTVTIKLMHLIARPRIHVSLADMGFASLRAFGGIGFSIEQPLTVFQFDQCSGIEIDGLEVLDEEGRADLNQVIERMKSDRGELHFRAVLKTAPPQHVGFGSKTALALGLIAGVNAFRSIGWSMEDMQRLSERGAASGVGIHSFFTGGVVWDAGHRADAAKQLLPSGSTTVTGITTARGAHSVSGCLASDAGPPCRASNDRAGRNQIFR